MNVKFRSVNRASDAGLVDLDAHRAAASRSHHTAVEAEIERQRTAGKLREDPVHATAGRITVGRVVQDHSRRLRLEDVGSALIFDYRVEDSIIGVFHEKARVRPGGSRQRVKPAADAGYYHTIIGKGRSDLGDVKP